MKRFISTLTHCFIFKDEDVELETKQHEADMENYRKQQLQKQRQEFVEADNDENAAEQAEILRLAKEKRKKERQLKRQRYEENSTNFLFSDQQLMDVLSSSSEEEVIV